MDEHHLSGVGLDVFCHDSELAGFLREGRISKDPEVVSPAIKRSAQRHPHPHNGCNTLEALARKVWLSVEQAEHFLKNGESMQKVPELKEE